MVRRAAAARARRASFRRPPFARGSEPDRRDCLARAEPRQPSVIAAAGHQRTAAASPVQFENEAGVIVEAAAESGCKFDGADLDAASGEESGSRLEQIERVAERDFC